jgi:hypothetical protein
MRTISRKFILPLLLTLVSVSYLRAQQTPVSGASAPAPDGIAVLDYWTPERMASARPMDLLDETGNQPADNAPVSGPNEPAVTTPSVAPGGKQTENDATASLEEGNVLPPGYSYPFPFTRYNVVPLLYAPTILPIPVRVPLTYPYITVGKVFFRLNNQNFVCSASVVNPHLLLTARHCIYDYATQQFATMVMFSPGYFNRDNPELGGRWSYLRLYTWTMNAPNWRYDIGFIELYDDDGRGCGGSRGGRPIESYTGFLGTFWGGSYSSVHWNQFGYPAAGMFNGQVMVEADSSTGTTGGSGSHSDTVQVGNDMTGGSSGGPWIRHMFPNQYGNMQNLANGVNSFEPSGRPFATGSPEFFQYNFGNLFTGAQGLPCP